MGGRAPRSAGELVCGSTGQGPAWSRSVHRCGVFSFVPSVFPVTWGVRLSWGGRGLRRGVEACCEGRELEILPVESVGGSGRGSRLPGLSLRLAVSPSGAASGRSSAPLVGVLGWKLGNSGRLC